MRAAVLLLNKAKNVPRLCRKQRWNCPIPKAIRCLPKIFMEQLALKEILLKQITYSCEPMKPYISSISKFSKKNLSLFIEKIKPCFLSPRSK